MKRVLIILAVMVLFAVNGYAANGDLVVDGNVTVGQAVLFPDGSSQTTAAKLPAGMISMYGGSVAPAGWFIANGTAVSRTTYAALFAAIGTVYGAGDGSTTFNLPNFSGVFAKGAGYQAINGVGYSGTLGAKSTDRMQGHRHLQAYDDTVLNSRYGKEDAGSHTGRYEHSDSGSAAGNLAARTSTPSSDQTNGSPRTGATTEPQSLGINFIIKY